MATPVPTKELKEVKESKPKEQGKAVVKSVISGDTVTLLLPPKPNGKRDEKDLTFSSCSAPKIGRQGKKDEPYAWQSREFIRNLCIGKQVDYVIENTVQHTAKTSNYGFIFVSNQNLALLSATEGLVRVKQPRENQKEIKSSYQELIDAGKEAEEKGRGIYNKDLKYNENTIRTVVTKFNSFNLYQQFKNKPIKGIVDYVREGSTLRLLVLVKENTWYEILIHLSGVQTPGFKLDKDASAPSDDDTTINTPAGQWKPEPFAAEAKYFTEVLLLHRDVDISLEGVDKQGNFFGTVLYEGKNIADLLLLQGLGAYIDWNANKSDREKFQQEERRAKEQKLRIWSLSQPIIKGHVSSTTPTTSTPASSVLNGKVREVLSGGALVVVDPSQPQVKHQVNFSSLKIPRMSVRENTEDEPWAWEAKEFLRKKLIGKPVRCVHDYARTLPGENSTEKQFYTVYADNKNIGQKLVELGYATVIFHKPEEKRSSEYEILLTAENKGKSEGVGVFGKKLAPVHHINNLSRGDEARSKAKQFLPHFQRAGKMQGCVDYVFSATKLKIYCEKQSCYLNFAVGGVRSPNDNDLAAEATEYTRDKCHQREVEFEIETQDKGGNFIGSLYVKKELFSKKLVEQGYASVHEPSASRSPHYRDLLQAQETAQAQHKKMWKDYQPGQEEVKETVKPVQTPQQTPAKMLFVTEIVDGSHFYAHFQGTELNALDDLMEQLQSVDPSALQNYTFGKIGDVCLSKFSLDNKYYRASIVERPRGNEVKVHYVDYGNSEVVSVSSLKVLDKKFCTLPPQAKECHLAYVKVPDVDNDDYGLEAVEYLRELVWDKSMVAHLEFMEGNKFYVSLGDPTTGTLVNAVIVKAGLGRVDRERRGRSDGDGSRLWNILKGEEEEARKAHRNMWQYGDIDDDEEDDRRPFRK